VGEEVLPPGDTSSQYSQVLVVWTVLRAAESTTLMTRPVASYSASMDDRHAFALKAAVAMSLGGTTLPPSYLCGCS
jgi:hypothetical protein